jgi:hypothetical protein
MVYQVHGASEPLVQNAVVDQDGYRWRHLTEVDLHRDIGQNIGDFFALDDSFHEPADVLSILVRRAKGKRQSFRGPTPALTEISKPIRKLFRVHSRIVPGTETDDGRVFVTRQLEHF